MATSRDVLRTPEERFAALPGFPWAPRYQAVTAPGVGEVRMHYVDEGPRDAPVVLMLHGEPTWSFLYRRVIERVIRAGFRAVAPDHVGFGRSDKLLGRGDYSYDRFVGWLTEFVEALDVRRITLVCQDWGGPIGLRALSAMPDRFDAVVAANTLLPNFEPPPRGVAGWPADAIADWANMARDLDDMPVGRIVGDVSVNPLPEEVIAAYDAPFPDPSYKAAVLELPCLIPIREDMPGVAENRETWRFLETFDKPFVTAFSDGDPTTVDWAPVFRGRVPGAKGQPHTEIRGAGHFLQEERGDALGEVVVDLMNRQYGGA